MTSQLKGGKTPPLLLDDLCLYNPQRLPPNNHNVLTQLDPPFEGKALPRKVAKNSCRHRWVLKQRQTSLLALDAAPGLAALYTAAALCTNCRCHIALTVDLQRHGLNSLPCPKDDAPLHHFIHSPNDTCGLKPCTEGSESGAWTDTQVFICSSPSCSAQLSTCIRPPRLEPEWVALLTDKALIKARAAKAIQDDPERFEGHAVPSAIEVISNLRAYIHNAMTSSNPRRIIANNKKWLLCLGDSCAELLGYLGFTRTDTDWMPPRPNVTDKRPLTTSLNILLDDVDEELLALLNQQPEDEKRMAKISFQFSPAGLEFERILGCKGYKRSAASRTIDLTREEQEDHPFYAGLGTKLDFHDDLIIFAYERQIGFDEANAPYYLECLQGIARGRVSEDLQTKVAIEASSGRISVQDIRDAYKSFGLEFRGPFLDDDTIIGTFQSRVADSPRQETELRRALNVIGYDRGSPSIQHVASNTVTTYEQALAWLSAHEDMDDTFLVNMYGVKVHENSDNSDLARHCMALIAEKRKSSALKMWLETGELGEVEMDFGQAYMRLNIDNRTVDDEMVLSSYNSLAQDAPSQIKDLKKALSAIAKSRNSFYLQSFLDSGGTEHKPSEWPVGLENIGNTCYLNSLLQFYFTIKPLRELVLNFDDYKMELNNDSFAKKQVGSRKVSQKEIDRAQCFVLELRKLFQSMITVADIKVTPEQELARLTLISSSTEENIRRMSILSGQRPSLGDVGDVNVHGPLPAATPPADDADTSMANGTSTNPYIISGEQSRLTDDVSSEGTLVENPATDTNADSDFMIIDAVEKPDQQKQILEDKENLAPTKAETARQSAPENPFMPLAESSPSRANEQALPQSPTKASFQDSGLTQSARKDGPSLSQPPNRPPPVPPRQKPDEQKKALQEEVEIGAQQDVTEVIANVLFQLQCAIKAESIDETGEQIDQIKKLFYAKQKSHTRNQRGIERTKEEFISDIKVDVASGPRDIYAALDGAFDEQLVEVGGSQEPQHATISQLPPILQILVQRAQFDPEKKASFKSINHLEMRETIYMDRYMDSSDPDLKQRRQACWEWKKELKKLEERRKHLIKTEVELDMPEVLSSTAQYLKQCSSDDVDDPIDVKPELLDNLEKAASDAKAELSSLENQIKALSTNINSQFADLQSLPYRLHSVFIHRGLVNAGHYWIYIYDFAYSMWRKYNDGYVTEVADTRTIYEAEQSTRPATPYFLVYVRDDMKLELVDSVCRNVSEGTQSSQGDTIMADDERGTSNLYQWSQNISVTEDVPQDNDPWGTHGAALKPGFW